MPKALTNFSPAVGAQRQPWVTVQISGNPERVRPGRTLSALSFTFHYEPRVASTLGVAEAVGQHCKCFVCKKNSFRVELDVSLISPRVASTLGVAEAVVQHFKCFVCKKNSLRVELDVSLISPRLSSTMGVADVF